MAVCKVLKKERVDGIRFQPQTIMDVPEHLLPDLAARGVVERIEQPMMTNLAPRPVGSHLIVKNPPPQGA